MIKPWLQKTFKGRGKSTVVDYPPKRKKPWLAENFPEMEHFHYDNYYKPWEPPEPPGVPPGPAPSGPSELPPRCATRTLIMQDFDIECGVLEYDLAGYISGAVGELRFNPGINMAVDSAGNEATIEGTTLTLPNAPDGTESTIDFWYGDDCGYGYKIVELPACQIKIKLQRWIDSTDYASNVYFKIYNSDEVDVTSFFTAGYDTEQLRWVLTLTDSDGLSEDGYWIEYKYTTWYHVNFSWGKTWIFGNTVATQYPFIHVEQSLDIRHSTDLVKLGSNIEDYIHFLSFNDYGYQQNRHGITNVDIYESFGSLALGEPWVHDGDIPAVPCSEIYNKTRLVNYPYEDRSEFYSEATINMTLGVISSIPYKIKYRGTSRFTGHYRRGASRTNLSAFYLGDFVTISGDGGVDVSINDETQYVENTAERFYTNTPIGGRTHTLDVTHSAPSTYDLDGETWDFCALRYTINRDTGERAIGIAYDMDL